jgi:uncharacterized protein
MGHHRPASGRHRPASGRHRPASGRHRLLAALLPTLLTLAGLVTTGAVAGEARGIQVSGAGEVRVVPDMARISLEARREGQDAAALKQTVDEVTARLLALTDALDIPRRDVTAAAVNIYPRYRHHPSEETRVDGVVVTRSVEVTLRDLTRIGDLINQALAAGFNGIGGVALDAGNRAELERAALDLAIDEATREAAQIAGRFGVRLGALQHAATTRHTVRPMMLEAMAVRAAPEDSFAPGEMTIRREIQATFAIEAAGAAGAAD